MKLRRPGRASRKRRKRQGRRPRKVIDTAGGQVPGTMHDQDGKARNRG